MRSRKWKILLSAAIVFGGLAYVFTQSFGDIEYAVTVDQVYADEGRWVGRKNVQMRGWTVAGSIQERIVEQKTLRTFQVTYNGKTMDVRHAGAKPDTFKDQSDAVVRGTVLREGNRLVFQALDGETGIMAKCPSKYDGNR